jgi:SpoVK/Ycf46/Vps4 family AAA+-type ATPase
VLKTLIKKRSRTGKEAAPDTAGPGMERLRRMPAVEVADVHGSAWDDILSMQNEKKTVEKQVFLPLMYPELADKHGISPPKGILLFGPPGTGKTVFAKGIAAKLGWTFVEISPSALGTISGKEAYELKMIFEDLRHIESIIVFFDEFEEVAMRPDTATKDERVLSNEFLKQMPRVRRGKDLLLICATNNIRMLNPALLRPGRFDLVLPLGAVDKESRKALFEHKARSLMVEGLDIDLLAVKTDCFTPADIEAVIASVSQKAFEKELFSGTEYKSTTEDFLSAISSHTPTITSEDMETFQQDAKKYCRADYCHLF